METNEFTSDPNSETLAQLAGGQPNVDAVQEPEQSNEEVETQSAGEPAETFEVDGQTFASEKEAFEFMRGKYTQSETDRLILEAKTEGMQEALSQFQGMQGGVSPQQVQQAAEDNDLDIDKFYEDPKGFLKQYGDQIRKSVKDEVLSASAQERSEAQAWSEFFGAHPDLEGQQEICQLVLNQNLEMVQTLARRDKKKAQDYLATKTREIFQNYVERTKPIKTLSNAKGGPSAGNAGVTPPVTQKSQEKSEEGLDFAAQLRSIRRR